MTTELLLVTLAGFLASLVDGALGMGFGPTSSSILLASGLSPASASTSVNLAKVVTGIISGLAHHRFGNVDRRLTLRLAVPGALGAVAGVVLLNVLDSSQVRPVLAVLLCAVGLRIVWRFSLPVDASKPTGAGTVDLAGPGVPFAAATGGVTNGLVGAWGPVVTPYLLHRGLPPRYSVGSVNTAEIAVAAISAFGLVASFGSADLRPDVLAAMLVGGLAGAPLAAWALRLFTPRVLGLAVGSLLLLTQVRELATFAQHPGPGWMPYTTVVLPVAVAWARPHLTRAHRSRPRR